MNSEVILKAIEKYLNSTDSNSEGIDSNIEIHITPTKGDPTKLQDNVSLIIFEKVSEGMIPRFEVTVEKY